MVTIIGDQSKSKPFLSLGSACPNCHNVLTAEKLLTAYRPSSQAEQALNQSAWFVSYVDSFLKELGCKVTSGRIINGDEVDLVASYLGNLILIECKDKDIELGDAYKFAGKIATLSSGPNTPDIACIVATGKLAKGAGQFVEDYNGDAQLSVIYGDLNDLKRGFLRFLNELAKSHFERTLITGERGSQFYRRLEREYYDL